jgi:16S rRNA (uracil1498-N3)-methyltransferase
MIRLHVRSPLAAQTRVALTPDQAHYLTRVMRLSAGDAVSLFNGADGQWRARLAPAGRKAWELAVEAQERIQTAPPNVELIVALVKRARLETIVEKASELGVRRIRLMITERTNADHANLDRLAAIATEAAEQCERLEAPAVLTPQRLPALLEDLDAGRRLMFCDEAGDARPVAEALMAEASAHAPDGPWSVLIGPEGGFSPAERAAIRQTPGTVPVSLGPRILRADTAAIAALSLWQSSLGDWRGA